MADYTVIHCTLPPSEKTAAITKVKCLEQELFDDDHHVRRSIPKDRANEIVTVINDLRHALCWLEIDLSGHWRWPA